MTKVLPWAPVALLCIGGSASAAPAQRHHPLDERELRQVQATVPDAVPLLLEGEALLREGNAKAAAERFEKARNLAPWAALIGRRHCQALTELGERRRAMKVCESVMGSSIVPMNTTAYVRAIMSGPEAPTPQEVEEALYFTLLAKRRVRNEPWGYAAECDIIARIGDESSLRKCTAELERIAPGHYETRRALARLPVRESRAGMTAGWVALGIAGLVTLGHALSGLVRSGLRTVRSRKRGVVAVAVLTALGSVSLPAPAAEPLEVPIVPGASTYPIDDRDPVKGVPTPDQRDADPIKFGNWLMEITYRAAEAEKKGDRPRAIRYYLAAAKAVPDRAITFSKLCGLYEEEKKVGPALQACRAALVLPGVSLADYERFSRLLVNSPVVLTADDRAYLQEILAHLRKQGDREVQLAETLECPFAARAEDEQGLGRCVARLSKIFPKGNDEVVAYQWAHAMAGGNYGKADEAIVRAKALKMKPAGIEKMEKATAAARRARWTKFLNFRTGAFALVALTAALGALLFIQRRRKGTPPAPPANSPGSEVGSDQKSVETA